ncbi:competence type IV pilus minor pilin ComGF [Metabacillus iocasae]|uniref:Competence protein ComGF n=1 Tax=Priestia iocasae TaxID=2291674 RepID=A0ABS2QQ11_9BACI|nr:competence type IV pilus minor pilin ComGF [Metabacillus iocasae]MBM7701550.1 competence protein ComGF [Metabacillus iocasae]
MKNQKGFTLVEMLISFSFFLLIVSLIPLIVPILSKTNDSHLALTNIEWELFIAQLTFEYREAKEVKVDASKLTLFTFEDHTVTYERYQDKLRRRVNQSGHEVLLQNVQSVDYKREGHMLTVELTDTKQTKFISKISKFDACFVCYD